MRDMQNNVQNSLHEFSEQHLQAVGSYLQGYQEKLENLADRQNAALAEQWRMANDSGG